MKLLYILLIGFFLLSGGGVWADSANETPDWSSIDDYAKNAPEFKDLSDLVSYLIKPYKGKDESKARVIFAWIVYHVKYDMYKASNIASRNSGQGAFIKNSDVYKTRLGVCGDFSDLFSKMARYAHLDNEKIVGVAGYNLTTQSAAQSPHAWNAVKINGKWKFVDVTWAISGSNDNPESVNNPKDYKKLLKNLRRGKQKIQISEDRSINEFWFLVNPKEMIKTHFPNKMKLQFLQHPVKPHKVWKENEKNKKQ